MTKITCKDCKGTGEINNQPCSFCDGSGMKEPSVPATQTPEQLKAAGLE